MLSTKFYISDHNCVRILFPSYLHGHCSYCMTKYVAGNRNLSLAMHAARQDCDAALVCIMTSQHNFSPPTCFLPDAHSYRPDQSPPFYTCTSQPPHNNHMITEPEAVDKRNQCLGEDGDWQDGMTLFSMYEDWTRVSLLHDTVLCLHTGRYACRSSALKFYSSMCNAVLYCMCVLMGVGVYILLEHTWI